MLCKLSKKACRNIQTKIPSLKPLINRLHQRPEGNEPVFEHFGMFFP